MKRNKISHDFSMNRDEKKKKTMAAQARVSWHHKFLFVNINEMSKSANFLPFILRSSPLQFCTAICMQCNEFCVALCVNNDEERPFE